MSKFLLTLVLSLFTFLNVYSQDSTPRSYLDRGYEFYFTSHYIATGTYNELREDYIKEFEDFAETKIVLQKDRIYTQFNGGEIKATWLVFDERREFVCLQCWLLEDLTSVCYNYCEDMLVWYQDYSEETNRWESVIVFTKLDTNVRESD